MVYVDTKCSILPDPQAQKLVCAVLLICLSTESTSEWKCIYLLGISTK